MISTSATLSRHEVEQLHKIKDSLSLSISASIRMSLKIMENKDLETYIDKSERSKEIERSVVHFSISEELYSELNTLSENYIESKSKIIGAAILAFSEENFFNK